MATKRDAGQPIILFAPGRWADASACASALDLPRGWELTWVANDGHFGEAFAFGQVDRDELPAIDGAPGAAVLTGRLELPREVDDLRAVSARLDAAGALAVRVEQSKAGWSTKRWLKAISAEPAAVALFRAMVVSLRGKGEVETCGMHLFGLPDAWIADAFR